MDSPLLPGTGAGRALWNVEGATQFLREAILAIEAEAAAAALAGARREVEALPYVFRQHTCWDDHEGPDAEHPHLDGSPCRDRVSVDAVDRAAILVLLTPGAKP